MAKNKKRKKRPVADAPGSAVALAPADISEEPLQDSASPTAVDLDQAPAGPTTAAAQPGWFAIYKPGQGYYTRMGTAIGAGILLIFGAVYLHGRLTAQIPAVQLGIPAAFLVLSGAVLFWIAGSNRKSNDFFIATEGEMKKVSWSTRREIVGATKVVLAFTVVVALFLFVVDVLFMLIFSAIDVLKIDLKTLLGLDS